MILYNRKKVKYRKDGYCWKKRKDGKTTREDHMKLKVQGVEVRPFVRTVTPRLAKKSFRCKQWPHFRKEALSLGHELRFGLHLF